MAQREVWFELVDAGGSTFAGTVEAGEDATMAGLAGPKCVLVVGTKPAHTHFVPQPNTHQVPSARQAQDKLQARELQAPEEHYDSSMGRRKKSTKKIQTRKKQIVSTVFKCPFCSHDEAVECKM
ncbi:Atp synthase subunit 4, partial [Globisporangium splendens]